MKASFIVATLLVVVNCSTDRELWDHFKVNHGRTYKRYLEDQQRFSIFQSNLRHIEEHNKKYENNEVTYYLKITQFADLTQAEFQQVYLNHKKPEMFPSSFLEIADDEKAPDSIDWRKKGVITEVKDQSICGSCWAFSSTGALEAQNAISHNVLVSLSEQQILDCDRNKVQNGCHGGDMARVFQDLVGRPLYTETSYPYEGEVGKCRKGTDSNVRIKSHKVIAPGEDNLKNAVGTRGPVSIGINGMGFAFYAGGVFNNTRCVNDINHGMIVVGYGINENQKYWILKNSWGKTWGDEGYIYLARNENLCGIGQMNVIPVIA